MDAENREVVACGKGWGVREVGEEIKRYTLPVTK